MAHSAFAPEAATPPIPPRSAAAAAGSRPGGLRLPLLYKVLLANASIVLLGAVAGTWATMAAMRAAGEEGGVRLGASLAVLGLLLSVATNYVVLRAAFRPLTALGRVAAAVRAGDLSARADPVAGGDPQVAHLAEALDRTLDQLERDRAELRSLASQVIRAQEEERKRVSRELHDDTAQLLFAQLLRVTAFKASPNDDVRSAAAELEESTVEALEGVRRLALELRPPALDDLGLAAALADLAQRFGEQLAIPVEFQARGMRGRLPADVELVLYRVAQEALTNMAKHGQARVVSVDLDRTATDVALSVHDNGRGFDPQAVTAKAADSAGLGLFGMAERVALVGGEVTIWSTPGHGTEVFAFIPLTEVPAVNRAAPSAAAGTAVA